MYVEGNHFISLIVRNTGYKKFIDSVLRRLGKQEMGAEFLVSSHPRVAMQIFFYEEIHSALLRRMQDYRRDGSENVPAGQGFARRVQ